MSKEFQVISINDPDFWQEVELLAKSNFGDWKGSNGKETYNNATTLVAGAVSLLLSNIYEQLNDKNEAQDIAEEMTQIYFPRFRR